MSDLSDLAEALTKDLPISARKVIDKALECGWELNKPGMTVVLRLNHPTDELAQAVYVCWVVGRTAAGKVSFRFDGCSTRGLVPLKPADLLEYLEDPTTIYLTDEDIAEREQAAADKAMNKPWDDRKSPIENLMVQTGAKVIGIEVDRSARRGGYGGPKRKTFQELMEEQKQKARDQQSQAQERTASPSSPAPPPLRIQAPSVSRP